MHRLKENSKASDSGASWTFLSNHAHVLFCLSQHPEMVLREVAVEVGITERAVQRIVADLVEAKAIKKVKQGRRNSYQINRQLRLRHPIESHRTVGELLALADQ